MITEGTAVSAHFEGEQVWLGDGTMVGTYTDRACQRQKSNGGVTPTE
jgi:hypothetical protein